MKMNGRCYGHRLNDPGCALNKIYYAALKAQMKAFEEIADPHMGGYYHDQLLFRGMYPYLPNIIAGDVQIGLRLGMETFTPLQIGGHYVQPDYNMLFFSACTWNSKLQPSEFERILTERFAGKNAKAFQLYLKERSEIFEEALKNCGADFSMCHLDYRWLKEDASDFYHNRVAAYAKCAKRLTEAASRLEKTTASMPKKLAALAEGEVLRAQFEASVLESMSIQQDAFWLIAAGRARNDGALMKRGLARLADLKKALPESLAKGTRAGLGKDTYYEGYVSTWLPEDIERRIQTFEQESALCM